MVSEAVAAAADQSALQALFAGSPRWRRIEVVVSTGSTNRDFAARAEAGEPAGAVLVAGHQSAGRGRLTRTWTAPPDTSAALSLLVAPDPAADPAGVAWGWLPLAVGLAVRDALVTVAGVPAEVKWPNDVLVRGGKVAGILTERVTTPDGAPVAVVGCGLNLTQTAADLPVPTATSLRLQDATTTDRVAVVAEVLRHCEHRLAQWAAEAGPLHADYRAACASLNRELRVTVPGDRVLTGRGVDVDEHGRLVLLAAGERRPLSVGDVVHVR